MADLSHAKTLSKAQEILDSSDLNVVILDWSLPDGDAVALLETIVARNARTTILALSSDNKHTFDPRASGNIGKSQTDLPALVASIQNCQSIPS